MDASVSFKAPEKVAVFPPETRFHLCQDSQATVLVSADGPLGVPQTYTFVTSKPISHRTALMCAIEDPTIEVAADLYETALMWIHWIGYGRVSCLETPTCGMVWTIEEFQSLCRHLRRAA